MYRLSQFGFQAWLDLWLPVELGEGLMSFEIGEEVTVRRYSGSSS
jgi:hypothetical protein